MARRYLVAWEVSSTHGVDLLGAGPGRRGIYATLAAAAV